MIIDAIKRFDDFAEVTIRDIPHVHPNISLAAFTNNAEFIQQVKTALTTATGPAPPEPIDPYAAKFAKLKTELEGKDIGD